MMRILINANPLPLPFPESIFIAVKILTPPASATSPFFPQNKTAATPHGMAALILWFTAHVARLLMGPAKSPALGAKDGLMAN